MKPSAVVFFYNRQNRYSINALLGSLQTRNDLLEKIDVYLPFDEYQLKQTIEWISTNGKYKKIILAISFTTVQVEEIKRIVYELKSKYKSIISIAGGAHTTGVPASSLKLGFDICVIGEAEEVFVNLIERILNDANWNDIPSLAFCTKDNNPVINNRPNNFVDLNKYPPISSYFNRYGPIEITRGCPYSCYFCQISQIFGTKLRHRSVEQVCKAVETMAKRGLYDTRFITPSLFLYGSENGKNLNLTAIEQLFVNVSKIIKPKGKLFIGTFPSEVRPEHINTDTVDLLKKYADNDNVIIGAQSGSERILELCHRRHTVNDIYNAVQLLTKAGFKVNIDFIFGLPYEEEKDIKQTIKVIDELTEKYRARIHAHIFIPLAGTKFQNCSPTNLEFYIKYCSQLKSRGVLYGNWEKQLKYIRNSVKT